MNDRTSDQPLLRYQVTLGFARVTVEGVSHQQAIREARRRLCQDLPRMYDLIQRADDSRFQVRPLAPPSS